MNYIESLRSIPFREFTIWNALIRSGFDTYLVGGGVRDIILDKAPQDWDFATAATPEQIKDVFRHDGYKVDLVGATFGVVIVDGIEVATFRGDRYLGGDAKNVIINYVDTIEEDLKRRDFTFNAMALDMNGNLIDPHNGVNDLLSNRVPIIEFVGDAKHRIAEDPNRIFRAFRFACVLNGTMSSSTFTAIRNNLHMVDMVAPERIRAEILKTLTVADRPSCFWNLAKSSGVLEKIFPEFIKCVNHDHGAHHPEDVWTHSMIAGDAVSKRFPLVRLAAFLHDVGKPRSYDPVGRSFHQHHTFSADIIREWMNNMKFAKDEIRIVVNLALVHMDGTRGISDKARRRLKNKLSRYGLDWREYVRLRIADRVANTGRHNFNFSEIRDYLNIFMMEEEVPFSVNHLALKGGDIIKMFAIPPGPVIGKVQRELLELVLDRGVEFNTRECLEEAAFNIFADMCGGEK